MKIIRKYALLLPAQLAKMELGSYGIESVILDENVAVAAPHVMFIGDVRLAVADEDEAEAEAILCSMKKSQLA